MAAPKLRRILAAPRIRALLEEMARATGVGWVEVCDAQGRVVWGKRPDAADAVVEASVEHDGEHVGTLRGDGAARPMARMLRYLVAEEANKKALAGEVLDAYREITLLYKLSQRLTASTKRQQVLGVALEESRRLIQGTACVVVEAYPQREDRDDAVESGPPEQVAELFRVGRRLAQLGTIKGDIVNDVSADERLGAVGVSACRAIVWAPLLSNERPLGLLIIGNAGAERDYTAADLSLLSTIASQAAPAFDNATLYEDLERLVLERTSELSQAKEEAEAANRAKNLFLASMSHELRTPLNALLGYAQILKRNSGLSRKQFEGLDVIQRSGEHLLTLINDILDLSRIEAGRVELSIDAFDLRALLEDVHAMFRVRAEEHALTFVCEVSADVPVMVEGDAKCLRQVLTNLLSNAVKFTAAGEVRLLVSRREHDVSSFVVEDTGVGIDAADREAIFESFRQSGAPARKAEGTGLGLAICKQLVELMGGTIEVQSELGRGSTFAVRLGLPIAAAFEPTEEQGTIVGYEGPRLRVLIADDDEASRSVLVHLLEPLGMDVHQARDGREALALATTIRPQLVLMDLVMPEVGGFEAIERLRQMEVGREARIIALSASVGALDRGRSRTVGADDFVAKPVRAAKLFAALEQHLGLTWIYAAPGSVALPSRRRAPESPALEGLAPETMQALRTFAQQGNISAILETLQAVEAVSAGHQAFVVEAEKLTRAFALRPLRKFLDGFENPGAD